MKSKAELLKAIAKNLDELANILQGDGGKVEPAKASPEPEKISVTLEQVRSTLASLSAEGKTAQVRNLIEKYGATKLSEVAPEHYARLMEDAKNAG